MQNDLFEAEELALQAAVASHMSDGLDAEEYRNTLGVLITEFRRLIRDTRRVITHSDRQERELNSLNARLRELATELDHKATHDPLTGAYNRRAVIERTEAYLQGQPVSLIVLDIDNFKCINDEYGHPAGDAVIVELVARLRAAVPERAEIGRVGGEEFTVVLREMDLKAAMVLAERMRAEIWSTPFPEPQGLTVTASFGVSQTPAGGNFGDAYGRADIALYRAKNSGKNSVFASEE